jgi:hypothetical protein
MYVGRCVLSIELKSMLLIFAHLALAVFLFGCNLMSNKYPVESTVSFQPDIEGDNDITVWHFTTCNYLSRAKVHYVGRIRRLW